MLCSMLILLIPLLMLFSIYLSNANSPFLNAISVISSNLPAITSADNDILSKVMDTYLKTSPLFALLFFFLSYKELRLKGGISKLKAVILLTSFTFFYTILICSFLLSNIELTTSKKLLKLASKNDFLLCFFYMSLYCGIYVFSYLYLWFGIGTYKLFKERQ